MATYYFATAGSSGNAGTSQLLPKQTVADHNGISGAAGDVYSFNRGDTFGSDATLICKSGSSGNPTKYVPYGTGANPRFRRTVTLTSWTLNSGSVYYATVTADPKQAFQGGTRLTSAASVAAMASAAGTFFWDSGTNRLYVRMTDSSNPSTKTVEASVAGTGAATVGAKSYVTLEDLVFEAGAKPGLTFRDATTGVASNVIVRRCLSRLNADRGYDVGLPPSGVGTRHADLTLEFCAASDNRDEDYWIGVCDRVQARFCTSDNNGKDASPLGANLSPNFAAAFRVGINAADVTLAFCRATNVYWGYSYHVESEVGTGFVAPIRTSLLWCWAHAGDTGSQAQGRYVLYDQGNQTLVVGCDIWSRHDEWAVYVDGSVLTCSGSRYYHNTIISEGGGAAIRFNTHTGGIVKNNIILLKQDNATFAGVPQSYLDVSVNSQTSFVSDYNYFGQTGSQGGGSPVNWKWGAGTSTTIAAWRTASSQDAHSLGGPAGSDPGFVSLSAGNYALTRTSPAINAGVVIASIGQRVAGSAPDIGAHEYGMVQRLPVGSGGIRRPAGLV